MRPRPEEIYAEASVIAADMVRSAGCRDDVSRLYALGMVLALEATLYPSVDEMMRAVRQVVDAERTKLEAARCPTNVVPFPRGRPT
jgi:hypothetical protein